MRVSPTCATQAPPAAAEHRGRRRRHAAQVGRVGHRLGDLAVGEAEGRLEAVAVEPIEGSKRNGHVRFLSAPAVREERCDGVDRHARRHLARHVAAHAVGDDEEAEVRPGAVTVFVAAASKAGVGGTAQDSFMAALLFSASPHRRPADTAGELDARCDLQPHHRFHEGHPSSVVVHVLDGCQETGLCALLRVFGARRVDVFGRSAIRASIVTRSGCTSTNPNAIPR